MIFLIFLFLCTAFTALLGSEEAPVKKRKQFVQNLCHGIGEIKGKDVVSDFHDKLDLIKTRQEKSTGKDFSDEALNSFVKKGLEIFPSDSSVDTVDFGSEDVANGIQEMKKNLYEIRPPLLYFFLVNDLVPVINFIESCGNYINGSENSSMNMYLDSKVLLRYKEILESSRPQKEKSTDDLFKGEHPEIFKRDEYQKYSETLESIYNENMDLMREWVKRVRAKFEENADEIKVRQKKWVTFLEDFEEKIVSQASGMFKSDRDLFDGFRDKIDDFVDIENFEKFDVDMATYMISYAMHIYRIEKAVDSYPYAGDVPIVTVHKILYSIKENEFGHLQDRELFLTQLSDLAAFFKDFLEPLLNDYPGLKFF